MVWDRAVEFARWQHLAMGRRARFTVPGNTYFLSFVKY